MEQAKQMGKIWLSIILAIIIVGFIGGAILSSTNNEDEEPIIANNSQDTKTNEFSKEYILAGGELGDYGRIVTLNASTDAALDRYLYKLPAGKYIATTTFNKFAAFWVVKDEIGYEDSEYPEILQYVGEQMLLTAGNDLLNGMAQKEVEFELKEDESVYLPGDNYSITVHEK